MCIRDRCCCARLCRRICHSRNRREATEMNYRFLLFFGAVSMATAQAVAPSPAAVAPKAQLAAPQVPPVIRFEAVSYTHLDVYKRQRLCPSASRLKVCRSACRLWRGPSTMRLRWVLHPLWMRPSATIRRHWRNSSMTLPRLHLSMEARFNRLR